MFMGAAVKLVLGLVILIVGLFLFVDSLWLHYTGVAWWTHFLNVLAGVVPIFLILVGLFVLWLEVDELKTNKEFSKESKKK